MTGTLSASIIYSIFVFFGMFSFAGAAFLFFQFRHQQPAYVKCWILGLITIGLAVLLICLTDVLPEYASYKLGNSFNAAAYIYFYYGALSLTHKKINITKVNVQALAAASIFFAGFIWVEATFGRNNQPNLVALGGLISNYYTGRLFSKVNKQNQNAFALLLTYTFYITAVVFSIRLVSILTGHVGFALHGGLINILCFSTLLFLGITKFLAFSGLVSLIESKKKEKIEAEMNAMRMALAAQELAIATSRVEQTQNQFLESLKALAKARDNETGNHIIRTQYYVRHIALCLRTAGHYVEQLSDDAIDSLVKAAPLHDIGKVGIPNSILLKNSSLSEEEWTVMKTHTSIGEAVLGAARVETQGDTDVIAAGIKVAGSHHEKWDGSGYPRGLSGQAIPLEARIMSIADMYDALVTDRPYKKAWSHENAVQEIASKRGKNFDPVIVDVFSAEQHVLNDIALKYKD